MSLLPKPRFSNLVCKLLRRDACIAALEMGRPMVSQTVVERYMKEIAGAM
jgi:hypothetical protein